MDNAPIFDTAIPSLGPCKVDNPLPYCHHIDDTAKMRMFLSGDVIEDASGSDALCEFEEAGPRRMIYFDPPKTKCAIVTCGGLCPGINDVIRAIVMSAHHNYHVSGTFGIRYGLQGFIPKFKNDIMELTPESVSEIHEFGGTVLSSSRGPQPPEEIVDALERMNVSILFMIGGDGTMKAADMVTREVLRRGLKIGVVGIPKTIDNDINFVTRSFGFDTAVEKATEAIRCAHVEALGAPGGIGMVKLMGRESGFIAAQASLALKEVNFVLVPEAPFELHGPEGFLAKLKERIEQRQHAVIVVAEGAGQDLCRADNGQDLSGNPILGDICDVLRREIKKYFSELNVPYTLKYIDPSYIIRSIPANSNDRIYCGFLGQHAVHAAMAGKTGMVVSKLQDRYIHLPLHLVTSKRRKLNILSNYWRSVMESTGQPQSMFNCTNKADRS
ncbi:ATP-dependent 6-phosphofructokinase [Desulfomicrobium escambiense]|uniref:ATP-dependent 6-phosphofructokinase n=1 Tax=Desulfomicrobium escambiense TaxID=29503 RepID=UPI0003FA2E5F|nr:ATP-dependent 6-phosphofructokinase [Desulfomicrobium escambiense]